VDPDAPVFRADDEALLRGAAAFETVRLRRSQPVLLRDHTDRLARSARSLGLPAPDGVDELATVAAAAADVPEGVLRLFRTTLSLVATVAPLPPGLATLRERGIGIVTVRRDDPGALAGVKATSYASALAAIADAERRGADDALYLGPGETVLEATMSNIWWREGDVLATPALSTGVLPGVTRGAVMRLAAGAGYRVVEGTFTLAALLRSDEVFTSSAVREIMPVVAVDGREMPRGEAASRLQTALEQLD